ncbi:MAG: APC family permease [Armatimonadetes bacterium]|nr:APC family permease [Armatimonadota bacterium]MDE2205881.1 APC family permease [Armatimonadota bacterium]
MGFYKLHRRLRRFVFGSPISSQHMEHTLLSKLLALPVFSSDAISSVAYATQQIVLVLGAAGLWMSQQRVQYTHFTMLITGSIVLLLTIVVMSYWQTIFGYPSGGGSYIVSKDNLGAFPGLIAAAALLIDYVLTVSVSIASGVQNLESVPLFRVFGVQEHLVLYCMLAILLLVVANLRGVKESGKLFAAPTYIFVFMCYLMIGFGLLGPMIGWHFHMQYVNQTVPDALKRSAQTVGVLLLLRAFANGCSAMTGTEAVSNGIPAFRVPKSRNAAFTLVAMGAILGSIFLGVSWLAVRLHVVYWEMGSSHTAPAVIDQISGAVFGKTGGWSWAYLTTQVFTALVLVLAANTSFADFPRLASILARDRYVPKQLANLGDKLVFNNGVVMLGLFAALLILLKGGSVDQLIPLYAVGVFCAFTLSQSGMVVHWYHQRGSGWARKLVINGLGAIATFVVLLDIGFEKFLDGAWMVILVGAVLVFIFRKIHAHYTEMAQLLETPAVLDTTPPDNLVLILISGIHRGTLNALAYGRSISQNCRAVTIELDPEQSRALRDRWEEMGGDIPLVVLNSQYRSIIGPILEYIHSEQEAEPNRIITVVIPEFVTTRWWHHLLHGNTGFILKLALLGNTNVVVTNVRYQLGATARVAPAATKGSMHSDGSSEPR